MAAGGNSSERWSGGATWGGLLKEALAGVKLAPQRASMKY
jgi:hypothetical protein